MPILPTEPLLFPEDLWEGASGGLEPGRPWSCLQTKPRQEKAAARDFRSKALAHYLPQVLRESRTPGGRRIRSQLPLFPGYIFFRGGPSERVEALKGNRIAKVLEVSDQAALVRDLHQVHRLLGSGRPVLPESSPLVGERVRIVEGAFAGMVGTVLRRGSGSRFVASIDFISRGASIEMEDWRVERA